MPIVTLIPSDPTKIHSATATNPPQLGGGGGHTLQDANGNALSAKTKQTFKGLAVSNVGDATVVSSRTKGVLDLFASEVIRAEISARSIDIASPTAADHSTSFNAGVAAANRHVRPEPGRYMMKAPLSIDGISNKYIEGKGVELFVHPGSDAPADPDAAYPGADVPTLVDIVNSEGITIDGPTLNGNYDNTTLLNSFGRLLRVKDSTRIRMRGLTFDKIKGQTRIENNVSNSGFDGCVWMEQEFGYAVKFITTKNQIVGTGLNDILIKATAPKGVYNQANPSWMVRRKYEVKISSTGAIDKYVWRKYEAGINDTSWGPPSAWTTVEREIPALTAPQIAYYADPPPVSTEIDTALYTAPQPLLNDDDSPVIEPTAFNDPRDTLLATIPLLSVSFAAQTGHTAGNIFAFIWGEGRAISQPAFEGTGWLDSTCHNNYLTNSYIGYSNHDQDGGFINGQRSFSLTNNPLIHAVSSTNCVDFKCVGNTLGYTEWGNQVNLISTGNTYTPQLYDPANPMPQTHYVQLGNGIIGATFTGETFKDFGTGAADGSQFRNCAFLISGTGIHKDIRIAGETFNCSAEDRVYYGINIPSSTLIVDGFFDVKDNFVIGKTFVECSDYAYNQIVKPRIIQKYGKKHAGTFTLTQLEDSRLLLEPATPITDEITVSRNCVVNLAGFITNPGDDGDYSVLKINKDEDGYTTSLLINGDITAASDTCTQIYFPLQVVANTVDRVELYMDTWTVEPVAINTVAITPEWEGKVVIVQNSGGTGVWPGFDTAASAILSYSNRDFGPSILANWKTVVDFVYLKGPGLISLNSVVQFHASSNGKNIISNVYAPYVTTAGGNVFISGPGGQIQLRAGINNSCVGTGAGSNVRDGNYNCLEGSNAGLDIRDGLGNTGVGNNALVGIIDGDRNVGVGNGAGRDLAPDTSYGIFLGYLAGPGDSSDCSYQVWLETNSAYRGTPLIHADGQTRQVTFNGDLNIVASGSKTGKIQLNGVDLLGGRAFSDLTILIGDTYTYLAADDAGGGYLITVPAGTHYLVFPPSPTNGMLFSFLPVVTTGTVDLYGYDSGCLIAKPNGATAERNYRLTLGRCITYVYNSVSTAWEIAEIGRHPLLDHDGNLPQSRSHDSADTDSATSAIHHTIGTGANQASAGNHGHGAQNFVTSADVASTSTGNSDLTNLTFAVVAGVTYRFRAVLFFDADATSGIQTVLIASGGAAVTTGTIYTVRQIDDATKAITYLARRTALSGKAGAAGATAGEIVIEGTIVCSGSGNIIPKFSLITGTTAATVRQGSSITVQSM